MTKYSDTTSQHKPVARNNSLAQLPVTADASFLQKRRYIMLFAALSSAIAIFDFVLYVFMADVIIANFFPANSNVITVQLEIFGLFSAGYLARPIGAIILGQYADIKGRRPALFISILLTAISTIILACLPT